MQANSNFTLPNAGYRYAYQKIFYGLCVGSVLLCLSFLTFLIGRMVYQGINSFYSYKMEVTLNIDLNKTDLKTPNNPSDEDLKLASYSPILHDALLDIFPNAKTDRYKKEIFRFISPESNFQLRDSLIENREYIGTEQKYYFDVSSNVEMYLKYKRKDLKYFSFQEPITIEFMHPYFYYKSGRAVFKTKGVFAKKFKHLNCFVRGEVKICDLTPQTQSMFLRISNIYAKVNRIVTRKNGDELIYAQMLTRFNADFVREADNWAITVYKTPENKRQLSDLSIAAIEQFLNEGIIRSHFPNAAFFTGSDSRNPEQSGILGAFIGSVMTLIVCLLCALPIGIAAAVYLEEFAPKNALTEFFEININNLASVPSIIYGLLGLALLLNHFNMPRSAPIVGGIVLGIMSLPVMIIATRAALRSVPQSLRDAALALGATEVQTFFHHTFPAAIPGIMTGAVLALSRAIGETAPLLLIGMVAFVSEVPKNIFDAATVLPVQIFLWTENPEYGYVERTAAAILFLLVLMIGLNAFAVYFRNKFERKY